MNPFLLDVNILIPLVDRDHENYDVAHQWLAANAHHGWATCPITENAVLRILSAARYPNSPDPSRGVVTLLRALRRSPHHQFWSDDISLLDMSPRYLSGGLLPKQVTDVYLLALAAAHGGRLATFDRRMQVFAPDFLANALHLIEA